MTPTKHDILGEAIYDNAETEGDQLLYRERVTSWLLQCRGCGNASMRQEFEGDPYPEPELEYFPPPVSRRMPQWLYTLDFVFGGETHSTLRELFREVYSALYAKNHRLAAMGTRAIIDVALTDKLGDKGGFQAKLTEARNQGLISQKQEEILLFAVEAGHAAAHRAFKPNPHQLGVVLDIVESTVQLLYILPSSAQRLSKDVPGRSAT